MWLPIKIGKLDISATLADASNALSKGQTVAVYVAGKPSNRCHAPSTCRLINSELYLHYNVQQLRVSNNNHLWSLALAVCCISALAAACCTHKP